MDNYVNAPATKMVATHCAVCARPLVDANSVEAGIGPDCRKKYGFDDPAGDAERKSANAIVYEIAAKQNGPEVLVGCAALKALGFERLAARILDRVCTVKVSNTPDGRIALVTPYREDAVGALRQVPGRRWDPEHKVNTFPTTSRRELWAMLLRCFRGELMVGPNGPLVIAAA